MKKTVAVTEYDLGAPVEKNLHLVFLSDLHNFPNAPIFDALSRLKPDAVLVGGDFISEHKNSTRDREFFEFSARLAPTFCILGNHEARQICDPPETIKQWVIQTGATVLDDDFVDFSGIWIGGLTSPLTVRDRIHTPSPNVEWLRKFKKLDGYKILLSHHPEHYEPYIKPTTIDLTLSGHAHGGQWRFFGKGVFAPGQGLFPKYTAGMYDNRLIVSRGLGNPCHIPKIGNKPEIVSIRFVK